MGFHASNRKNNLDFDSSPAFLLPTFLFRLAVGISYPRSILGRWSDAGLMFPCFRLTILLMLTLAAPAVFAQEAIDSAQDTSAPAVDSAGTAPTW